MDAWVEDVKNAAKNEKLWGMKLGDIVARAKELDKLDSATVSQDEVHPMFLALKAHLSDDVSDNCRLKILNILQDNREQLECDKTGSNSFTDTPHTSFTRTSPVCPLPSPIDLLPISPNTIVEDRSQPLDAAPAQFLTPSVHGDLSKGEATSSMSERHNQDAIPRTSRPRRRNVTKSPVDISLDDDPDLLLLLRIGEKYDEPCEFCASNSIVCYKALEPTSSRVKACVYCHKKKRGCSLVQKAKAASAASRTPSILQTTEANVNAENRPAKPQAQMQSVPSIGSSAPDCMRHTAREGLAETDNRTSNSGARRQSNLHPLQAAPDTFSRPSSDIAESSLPSSEIPAESTCSAPSTMASGPRALSTCAEDTESVVCERRQIENVVNMLSSAQQTFNNIQFILDWITATFMKPVSTTSESRAPVPSQHLRQHNTHTPASTSDSQIHPLPSQQQFFPPPRYFFDFNFDQLKPPGVDLLPSNNASMSNSYSVPSMAFETNVEPPDAASVSRKRAASVTLSASPKRIRSI